MTEFEEKIQKVEQKLSRKNGVFNFFALTLRDGVANRYDLLISASWLDNQNRKSFDLIVEELKIELPIEDMIKISRIVLLSPYDPVLTQIKPAIKVSSGGVAKIQDSVINNFVVKEMTIFSSQ